MSAKLKKKICNESGKNIPFIDLKLQQDKIRIKIDQAIKRVLDHGKYIMGPEVFELEKKLAEFSKVKNVIACSSGTDALYLLMAKVLVPKVMLFSFKVLRIQQLQKL